MPDSTRFFFHCSALGRHKNFIFEYTKNFMKPIDMLCEPCYNLCTTAAQPAGFEARI